MQALLSSQVKSSLKPALKQMTLDQTRLALLGLTAAGAILRFMFIGSKSIWLDEGYSIAITQRSLIELLKMVVRTDTHPPLYYLMLKIWLLFSQSEGWARSLSAIFSVLAIPMMYLLLRELYQDRKAGLLGACILAFSPFHIWYAQETRMYAPLTFFILASAFFFLRALRNGARRDWLGYIVMTVLALYTDNGAIWYLATLIIFSLLYIRRFWNRAKSWLLSHLVIGLIYAFWLPFFAMQAYQVTESFWLPPPSVQTVVDTFLDFHSYNFPWIEAGLLYMSAIFVFAYIVPGKSLPRRLASLWLFVPIVFSLVLSLTATHFLKP